MKRDVPLRDPLYQDPVYIDVCRLTGYQGCNYRDLWERLKPATEKYGQRKVETATAHLLTYERQFSVNPPPLAPVRLREDVRKLCWQLLGPPPEQEDAFWRHPDGTSMQRPENPLPGEKRKKLQPEPKTVGTKK